MSKTVGELGILVERSIASFDEEEDDDFIPLPEIPKVSLSVSMSNI